MRAVPLGLEILTVLSVIGAGVLFVARSPSRKTREWPQEMHVVTPAGVVDRIRTGDGPVLVVIFAGWCDECRREIPALDRALAAFVDTDLQVVAVAVDEDADSYTPFATPHVALRPMRLAPGEQDGLVRALWSLGASYHRSIPYVALFDRHGALVRDRWPEAHRVDQIRLTLSSLSTNAALR